MQEWFFLLLGLFLGIPFSYFAEFTFPWVKSYFKKSSLSIRDKKLYSIIQRYQHIKRMREVPTYLNLHMFRSIGFVLILLVLQLANTGLDILGTRKTFTNTANGIIVVAVAFFNIVVLNRMIMDTNDAIRFPSFEERVLRKVEKLGGNPKDLDRLI